MTDGSILAQLIPVNKSRILSDFRPSRASQAPCTVRRRCSSWSICARLGDEGSEHRQGRARLAKPGVGVKMRGKAAVVVVALALGLVPMPRSVVERVYSTGTYLDLQPLVTGLSNTVPLAMLDVLLCAALAFFLGKVLLDVARRPRLGPWRVLARACSRALVWAAAFYVAFVVLWGLNYRRLPISEKLSFDSARVSQANARALASRDVDRVNALHDPAHALGWPDARSIEPSLADAFSRTQQMLRGGAQVALPGRPKYTLLDVYFRRAAVTGMTDPYFLETLVSDVLLPFERPFVVAHEWSHLAGYADEGEANFVGWLTCLRGTAADQYSGWLFLYGELAGAVDVAAKREMESRLAPGPRADLRAVAERLAQEVNPELSALGWRAYDRYLRANGVESGARSYAEVIRLILGTQFSSEGMPLLSSQ
jgi:hypothetical protein